MSFAVAGLQVLITSTMKVAWQGSGRWPDHGGALAMAGPWLGHGLAMFDMAMARTWPGLAMAGPYMVQPLPGHGLAMAWPWPLWTH